MICPHCHSDNRDGAKFCNECGLPLTGRIAEAAAAAAAEDASAEALRESAQADESLDPDFAERVSADQEDVDEPFHPGASGSLDPATLPAIDVAGVNVDADGNAFDFGPIGEESGSEPDESADGSPDAPDADLSPYVPKRPEDADPGRTADLSGIDECLVDSNYVPPQASWRSGDTMELPRIEGQAAPKQKEFRAPDANQKKSRKGKVAAVVVLVLLVAAGGAAGATYQMELWGGKMLPNVVGMTQTDATFVLEGKGFAVRTAQVKSDETEGVVLLMDPGAGARQDEGTEVVIHVSQARTVPEVVGGQRDEVAAKLEDAGFENVSFDTEKSNEREGTVLAVSPAAGERATSSTPIIVTVATPYTVPDISGMSWDQAVAAIEAEGLVASSVYVYDESVPDGNFLGTSPSAGEKVEAGSTVTINIAKSRGAELELAALAYLGGLVGGTVDIGGTSYIVDGVNSVAFQGSDTTSFSLQARAVTTLDGETVTGSQKEKTGTIVWDSANSIVSIS